MIRPQILIVLCSLLAVVLAGCPQRSEFYGGSAAGIKPKIVVDAIESSPDEPVPLCGEQDLGQFLMILYCANGAKVYRNWDHALTQQDTEFEHTTSGDAKVMLFKAACYDIEYKVYLTIDACEEMKYYQ